MRFFQKKVAKVLGSVTIILLAAVTLFCYFLYRDRSKRLVCATESKISIHGTKNLSSKAKEGKQFFDTNCAACHKLHANSTGPALSNLDSLVFYKWFYHKNLKIDTTKFHKLGIDYHRNLSKNNFDDKDLEEIYAFISGS